MSASVVLLLVLTLSVAVLDWVAVGVSNKRLEYVAKPATMVLLIAAVFAIDPTDAGARSFFVVGLLFSLLGDIFLMLPDRDRFFVFGLGSFLIGHLAYIPGLFLLGFSAGAFLVGVLLVVVALVTVGRRVVRGVHRNEPRLVVPVIVYMGVISLMVATAISSGKVIAVVGAVLFYGSDTLIAWNGFVKPLWWANVAIMVTYHLGQIGLALALV